MTQQERHAGIVEANRGGHQAQLQSEPGGQGRDHLDRHRERPRPGITNGSKLVLKIGGVGAPSFDQWRRAA